MAHWAKIDENNIVISVVVTPNENDDEGESLLSENMPGTWIKTSYNTRGGVHYDSATGEPSEDQGKALRGNFAGIGMVYDAELDAFYAPKIFDSWILNEEKYEWEAPSPKPTEGGPWVWNESSQSWMKFGQ